MLSFVAYKYLGKWAIYMVKLTHLLNVHPGIPPDSEQFIGLCQQAEDFMDSCVLSETSEQFAAAVNTCQQAIDLLKMAMRLPNIGQKSYNYAQKKSNSCVIKLRSLQKRLMALQELGNSTNSGDAEHNNR